VTTLTWIKIGLALIGLAVFAAGVRVGDGRLRWIAIGFVAAAWLLRFVRQKPRDEPRDAP
jgi:hypothetical protein